MRCLVLINRGSGTVRDRWTPELRDRVMQALRENGWTPDLREVDGAAIPRTVEAALREGTDAVIAGGGDGTTRSLAGMVQRVGVPLGVLPFGTLNLAARDLGTPLDPVEAAASLRPGVTREVDVLEVNGHACLCMLLLGFYPMIADAEEEFHGHQWWVKSYLFTRMLFRSYFQTPAMHLTVTGLERAPVELRTRFLALIPGEYRDEPGLLPKREGLSSGHFTVYSSRHRSRWSVAKAALRYVFGRAQGDPDLDQHSATEAVLRIRGKRRVPAAIDGELLQLENPIQVKLHPRALTVLKPVRVEESETAVNRSR